jgi:thioredoxin-related protein
MVRVTALLLLALALTFLPPGRGEAARPLETGSIPQTSDLELVVLEVESCLYCSLFRRDVLPKYQASARAKSVPIRFLDLNDKSADELALDGPVLVVPTVVLMKMNREVGRVPGYVGPENFFHAVNHLLARAD